MRVLAKASALANQAERHIGAITSSSATVLI